MSRITQLLLATDLRNFPSDNGYDIFKYLPLASGLAATKIDMDKAKQRWGHNRISNILRMRWGAKSMLDPMGDFGPYVLKCSFFSLFFTHFITIRTWVSFCSAQGENHLNCFIILLNWGKFWLKCKFQLLLVLS